jgi:hypothetical protein
MLSTYPETRARIAKMMIYVMDVEKKARAKPPLSADIQEAVECRQYLDLIVSEGESGQ